MSGYHVKNPGSEINFTLAWDQGFLTGIESISADLGWRIEPDMPDGLVVQQTSFDATTTTALLAGGQAGDAYLVTSAIETDQGREVRRSVTVRIANI